MGNCWQTAVWSAAGSSVLDPDHALVEGLRRVYDVDEGSPRVKDYAALLYGQALIAEGVPLEDPARFTRLLTELMTDAVRG